MAKDGTVLMKNKEGEVTRFPDDHPAVELFDYINEMGGEAEAAVRSLGFRMTSDTGSKLGFCVPKKEGYSIFLTTIQHDSEILEDFELEISKGSGGLAVIKGLQNPAKTVKMLKSIYAAAEEAKPEKEAKPKKEKKKAKDDDEKSEKKPKKEKKKAKDDNNDENTSSRKKRKKEKKQAADDDE